VTSVAGGAQASDHDRAEGIREIAAGLTAAGMTALVEDSGPVPAVFATLARQGRPRITAIAYDGGFVVLRYRNDPGATPAQITSTLTRVLAVITMAEPHTDTG
jgi:hypothetical protein